MHTAGGSGRDSATTPRGAGRSGGSVVGGPGGLADLGNTVREQMSTFFGRCRSLPNPSPLSRPLCCTVAQGLVLAHWFWYSSGPTYAVTIQTSTCIRYTARQEARTMLKPLHPRNTNVSVPVTVLVHSNSCTFSRSKAASRQFLACETTPDKQQKHWSGQTSVEISSAGSQRVGRLGCIK